MAETTAGTAPAKTNQGLRNAIRTLGGRVSGVMFGLGFAAGLPNAMIVGTLSAWLAYANVDLATIGVITWVGLFYSFKFLWAPALSRAEPLPPFRKLGLRRGWLIPFQLLIAFALVGMALSGPYVSGEFIRAYDAANAAGLPTPVLLAATGLGLLVLFATLGAFASASQDIVIDAWRIEIADERNPVDLLSTVYQFGYRTASFAGGAGALLLAGGISVGIPALDAGLGWQPTYVVAAVVMGLGILASLLAPEPREIVARGDIRPLMEGAPVRRVRETVLWPVLAGWVIGGALIALFMADLLTRAEASRGWFDAVVHPLWTLFAGETAPTAGEFTRSVGVWVVVITVLAPAALAAWLSSRPTGPEESAQTLAEGRSRDRLYAAILLPMVELFKRLGIGALLVLAIALTYRLTDSVWGPLANVFYIQELGYSGEDIAYASKTFGVIMTIAGIALGGISIVVLGTMRSLVIGAIIAAVTNLLYADLARGSPWIDSMLALGGINGNEVPIARLMFAITAENLAGGYAGAAFIAYLSSMVAKSHAAVQYALLSSLAFILGAISRGMIGDLEDQFGFAWVFELTVWVGMVAVVLAVLAWLLHGRRTPTAADPEPAG
jgi:PAT family beta-lactamase induction signal transducer AmpG